MPCTTKCRKANADFVWILYSSVGVCSAVFLSSTQQRSALSLLGTIRVAFVLRRKRPPFRASTEEHLGDFDPIAAVWACKKCFYQPNRIVTRLNYRFKRSEGLLRTKFITPSECRRTVIYPARQDLEEADGDVAVSERERFAEIAAGRVHACGVTSEVTR